MDTFRRYNLTHPDPAEEKTNPILNIGNKWRIGYYEGGSYSDYQSNFKAAIKGLMEMDWMETVDFPAFPSVEDTKILWNWLSTDSKSKYLEFLRDAYWSARWNKDLRNENKRACIERLNSGDIDFMFAMGTWAGQDLANDEHHIPTFCLSSSDPIKSKIIKSASDSINSG